jgi:hypothetical protein
MATRKPRKFGDGGGVREGQNANIDDDTRARAMKFVQQQAGKSDSEDAPAKKAAPKATPKPAPKPAPKAESAAPTKKASADDIPRDKATPVSGEKVDSSELGRNISNALNATPGIQAVGRIASAGKAAQKAAGSRAVSTAVDDGVTFLGKSGRRQVGGFDEIANAPKAIADGSRKAVGSESRTAVANNPTKRITGPSKRSLVERDRAARASKRQSEMGETNASRHGLDTKADDYADRAKEARDNLGGSDWSLGMKRGGKVKPKATFKAGGSVSSRADGIASRGKTNCKIC